MLGWSLLVALASAEPVAPPALKACCDAAGASQCPDRLLAIGPGTDQRVSPDGATATGLWALACATGATFEPQTEVTTTHPFPPASVLTPVLPSAMACFQASCRLPEATCLRFDGNRVKLARCDDGSDVGEAMWHGPPRAPGRAVVIGGRVLNGDGHSASSAPTRSTVRPAQASPPVAPAQPLDARVPRAAPDPCRATGSLRAPSNQQVDEGNEAMVAGQTGHALDKYRAAITINKCNAFAWAALGDALLLGGHAAPATESLMVATRLMPSNLHAWITLGRALEQIGDRSRAAEAYRAALDQKPGHAPAAQGLSRVQ